MKQTPLILSIIAIVASAVFGILSLTGNSSKKPATVAVSADSTATAGSIVYFNVDKVMAGYDMANDLRSVVETKIQGIQAEIDRRGNRLQKDVNEFQNKIDKGLLTRSVAEAQGQKLQQQQNDYQNYALRKQNEMAEEQQVMMNQILDAIKTYIDKYNATRQYALILATQGEILPAPVAAGDAALDITDDLLLGLNEEYIKTKDKGATAEKEIKE
ncbi:MAG: OmpH family outer membrane protein [Bacteroidales bacterium]|jgi:outer membrane protein|nr:OmpH family outer membrane protein [Bacteroidales bacterium]